MLAEQRYLHILFKRRTAIVQGEQTMAQGPYLAHYLFLSIWLIGTWSYPSVIAEFSCLYILYEPQSQRYLPSGRSQKKFSDL